MIFEDTICPICNSLLEHSALTRFNKYHCPCGHYAYLDLFELNAKSIIVELKDYSLTFRFGTDFEIVTVYKETGGSGFIMHIPMIQFKWDKLEELNERIKTLVIFS